VKLFCRLFSLLSVSLFVVQQVYAVFVTVSDIPPSISIAPFSVTISVFGANTGKNYLRVDLYKEGSSNYFGETFNGNEWYFGSTGTSYFPIDITSSSSTASAAVQVQVGDPSATDYSGSGPYKLRVRRYTSASSYSVSSPYDVVIDVPTPTQIPTPSCTPMPVNTSTPSPTATPVPPTKTPTNTVTPTVIQLSDSPMPIATVASAMIEVEPEYSSASGNITRTMGIASALAGIGFALLSGVTAWQQRNQAA
jgi:hypothetical protein